MSDVAELINALVGLLWLVLAFAVFLVLRTALAPRIASLTKLGLGVGGVTLEFAEQKLNEAVERRGGTRAALDQGAKRSILRRLQRNADLLAGAHVLWVDDHPENNRSMVELLSTYGARVETARSNPDALALLATTRYDVIISDVGRDDEGPDGGLKGVELAETIFNRWQRQVLLFAGRFDPAVLPGATAEERLQLVALVERVTFARARGIDEVLHYLMDILERGRS